MSDAPGYLIEARKAQAAAWNAYDAAIEYRLKLDCQFAFVTNRGQPIHSGALGEIAAANVERLGKAYEAAESEARAAYARWQMELRDTAIAAQVAAEYGEQDYRGTAQDAEMFSVQ